MKSPLRTLSVLLTVAVVIGVLACLPVGAATEGDYWYAVENGEATVTRYNGNDKNVKIPSTLGGSPVTAIGDSAFYGCDALESIEFPPRLKTIKRGAFSDCESLKSITIPASVTEIGTTVFAGCSDLASVTVEAGNPTYKSAGNCVIEKATDTLVCGCSNSVIPNGVRAIGEWAFCGCDGLTSVVLPGSVREIGDYAFNDCDDLTNVVIPGSVTEIGDYAFYDCDSLTSVKLPGSVTEIGDEAFAWSGITSITIPASVTSIGDQVFAACSNLEHITVQTGNAYYEAVNDCLIEKSTKTLLQGCKTSVIPNGVKVIGDHAFWDCSALASVVIPDGVTEIGDYALAYSGITSITIPASVTTIGDEAFAACSDLAHITVQTGNAYYEAVNDCLIEKSTDTLLRGCSDSVIPDGVKVIGDGAFTYCDRLTSVAIPDSVTTIGNYVFEGCSALTSIFIPIGVTTMGWYVFEGCDGLAIYCEAPSRPAGWDDLWTDFSSFGITVQWGSERSTLLGDVNGDGTLNANDYMMLKRYVLHTFSLTADRLAVADINADGDVNANDYMILKRAVLGTYKLPSA